jgi:hypothetical protein
MKIEGGYGRVLSELDGLNENVAKALDGVKSQAR